jgi:Transglutaminase-like superfamily
MRCLRKLAELPGAERWLLAEAALAVVLVRLGLWLLPFRLLRRGLGRLSTRHVSRHFSPERIAWAVMIVSSYIPVTTCLTQALAAQALLSWRGVSARLRIGVTKDVQGQFAAHAWVEVGGRVLIGGSIRERYTPLPDLVQNKQAFWDS